MQTLSVIVPAFNEAATIAEIIRQTACADTLPLAKEILVVDDGSVDDTVANAQRAIRHLPDGTVGRVIVQGSNKGKGAAVARGYAECTGDLVIVQDADLEYDPAEFALLLRPILTGRADIVVGSRFIGGHPRRVVYLSNAIGNRAMSLMFSLVSGMRLTDIHCCYLVLPGPIARSIAPMMRSDRWGFNPELCSLIADWRRDLRVVEVGISYYRRSKSEGKKIRFRHGMVAVLEIFRFNLRPSRPVPPEALHLVRETLKHTPIGRTTSTL